MIKATLDRQLMVFTSNQIGSLAEITSIISSSGINLVAICAYAIQDKVAIMLVTEDNNAARKLLESQDCKVQEEEVVLLTLDNKPGALQAVTERIAQSGIDLKLIYGSSDPTAQLCRIVLISENNLDVMMIIKTELERS
jgi:hypothetical protein